MKCTALTPGCGIPHCVDRCPEPYLRSALEEQLHRALESSHDNADKAAKLAKQLAQKQKVRYQRFTLPHFMKLKCLSSSAVHKVWWCGILMRANLIQLNDQISVLRSGFGAVLHLDRRVVILLDAWADAQHK